jgi:hypothetical protein
MFYSKNNLSLSETMIQQKKRNIIMKTLSVRILLKSNIATGTNSNVYPL